MYLECLIQINEKCLSINDIYLNKEIDENQENEILPRKIIHKRSRSNQLDKIDITQLREDHCDNMNFESSAYQQTLASEKDIHSNYQKIYPKRGYSSRTNERSIKSSRLDNKSSTKIESLKGSKNKFVSLKSKKIIDQLRDKKIVSEESSYFSSFSNSSSKDHISICNFITKKLSEKILSSKDKELPKNKEIIRNRKSIDSDNEEEDYFNNKKSLDIDNYNGNYRFRANDKSIFKQSDYDLINISESLYKDNFKTDCFESLKTLENASNLRNNKFDQNHRKGILSLLFNFINPFKCNECNV